LSSKAQDGKAAANKNSEKYLSLTALNFVDFLRSKPELSQFYYFDIGVNLRAKEPLMQKVNVQKSKIYSLRPEIIAHFVFVSR